MKQFWSTVLTTLSIEFKKIIINPAVYILSAVFLLAWLFFFFRGAFLIGEASLRGMFEMFPWLVMILISALTMGIVAKEKKEQTLELLLTHPVTELQIILGKYGALKKVLFFQLLISLPLAVVFSLFGTFDWGEYLAQLLGSLLLGSMLISIGVFLSSLFKDQISALMTSLAVSFTFLVLGSSVVTDRVPTSLLPLFSQASALTHYFSIIRGVLDSRDVWYFVSITLVFLSLSVLLLYKEKFGQNKKRYHLWQTGTWVFIIITIASNILGNMIPGRLDLTKDQRYSLSEVTKESVSQLEDTVTLTLYISDNIPSQLQPVLRDAKDILSDYAKAGGGKIAFETKNTSQNIEIQQEAQQLGIQEVQFNVISNEELQFKTGYLGLNIAYQDQNEILPYVNNPGLLEFFITSNIEKMSNPEKKTVSFSLGHGEKSQFQDLQLLSGELSNQFTVTQTSFPLADETASISAETLIIPGPSASMSAETITTIQEYLESGGNVLVAAEGVGLDDQTLTTTGPEGNVNQLLESYGISVDQNLVYDVRSYETIQRGNGQISYFEPYPFWVRAATVADEGSPITNEIGVSLPWVSSVSFDENAQRESFSYQAIIRTTPFAGVSEGVVSVDPSNKVSTDSLAERTVAVAVIPPQDSSHGRLVVVGDSEFMTNPALQSSAGNAAFTLELISWLTQETSLSDLKMKQSASRTLVFASQWQIQTVVYGSYALSVLGPVVIGSIIIGGRRRKKDTPFQPIG